ncbi:hypothetical protein CAY60_008545 [Shouchella clausii]|uniref:MucB/RseB N-terminal domain-containing protein n=1 Tax=Shouchella clausii TaxID=79880 RepID=A0A268P4L5_SHOCL|nr:MULTISPECIES: hypothetical protein [Shouchella]ALA50952.1 hypothetical protein DB29_00124 [Shouchella clausii]MBU3231758.1 hypothetical protein [Shouchella clausii]MBU3264958.1 hypothetical protein [Shouchella clausii]MBU3507579.1 hypothetical protein [Shouchella clausii]MBU3534877.1 hypothetical protein [Shouchella clausii]
MKRQPLFLAAITGLLFTGGCSFMSINAEEVLEQALAREEKFVPYTLIKEFDDGYSESVYAKDEQTQRVDFAQDGQLLSTSLYVDGHIYEKDYESKLIYEANAEEAMNPLTPKEALLDEVNYLLKNHEIEVVEGERFLKRDVFKLHFYSETDHVLEAELWVDKKTYLQLKTVYTYSDQVVAGEAVEVRFKPDFPEGWFDVEEDGFVLVGEEEPVQIEKNELADAFDKSLRLPNEVNGLKLENIELYDGGSEDASVVASYVDSEGKEIGLTVSKSHGLEWIGESETEPVRGIEVHFNWEPSSHYANWTEDGLLYELFTMRDWSQQQAVELIEGMELVSED